MARRAAAAKVVELRSDQVGHAADSDILMSAPYRVEISIRGNCPLLFHRWQNEVVEEKAKAAKGSRQKKTDNVESYVYRDDKLGICVPGEYFRQSVIHAAKYEQDPRSPRKSAMDLFKAGFISLTELAPLGTKEWHYEDRRRVVVQRAAITRTRPAFHSGWEATFIMMVTVPEYIPSNFLHRVCSRAGLLVGVGDFRPSYGRYDISKFEVLENV